jgi:hypothetical protein
MSKAGFCFAVCALFVAAVAVNAAIGGGLSSGTSAVQVALGPTFPPDPWDVALGPTFPPDPWDVALGPTFPPDPWDVA